MQIPNSISTRKYYRIQFISDDFPLAKYHLAVQNTNPGAPLIFSEGYAESQHFLVYPFGPDEVIIASRHSGLVLVINGGSPMAGAGVVQWNFQQGVDQQAIRFRLEEAPGMSGVFTLAPYKNYELKLCAPATPSAGLAVTQALTPSYCVFKFVEAGDLPGGASVSPDPPPLPQVLTSMVRPIQSTTEPILTQVARLPYFTMPTLHGRSVSWCARNTPYYELRRLDSYALLEFFSDQRSQPAPGAISMSREFSWTTGWSEERRKEFTNKVGVTLGTSAEVEAGFGSWECSAEVSYEHGWNESFSRSLHSEQTTTQLINYYVGESVAIWAIVHTFELRTAGGQLISSWKTQGQDSFISRFAPA